MSVESSSEKWKAYLHLGFPFSSTIWCKTWVYGNRTLWRQMLNPNLLSQTGSGSWREGHCEAHRTEKGINNQSAGGHGAETPAIISHRDLVAFFLGGAIGWLHLICLLCVFDFCWSLLLFVLVFSLPTSDRPIPSCQALGPQKSQFSITAKKTLAHTPWPWQSVCVGKWSWAVRCSVCVCVSVCTRAWGGGEGGLSIKACGQKKWNENFATLQGVATLVNQITYSSEKLLST